MMRVLFFAGFPKGRQPHELEVSPQSIAFLCLMYFAFFVAGLDLLGALANLLHIETGFWLWNHGRTARVIVSWRP